MFAATTSPDTETQEAAKSKASLDRPWHVIVWNDHVNLMNYVEYVFEKVLSFDKPTATRHMLEVHNLGKSCVATTVKERAELYMQQLQFYGLKTTIQRSE